MSTAVAVKSQTSNTGLHQVAVGAAQVNSKFRTTAAGMELGRSLFDPSYKSYFWNQGIKTELIRSPAMIAQVLRAAGVPVPKGVMVAADTAQIIMAGGAVISSVEAGASIASCSNPVGAVITAAVDLMEITGLVKKDDPMIIALTILADIAMVVSSSGANVLADIKLVFDVYETSHFGDAIAFGNAASTLQGLLAVRKQTQKNALTNNFADYTQGKMSVFELMGHVAEESPDYFSNYFPDQQMFFPVGYQFIYAEGGFTDFWGYHGANTGTWVKTLLQTDHETISRIIFTKLISPLITSFRQTNQVNLAAGKVSVETLALLALMPGNTKIFSQNFNVADALRFYGLTPDDFRESFLDSYLKTKLDKSNLTNPITLNGVDYFTPYQSQEIVMNAKIQRVIDADFDGDIETIVKDPDANTHLRNWGAPIWPAGDLSVRTTPEGAPIFSKVVNEQMMSMPSRSFWNYFSMLSLIEQIRGSAYFQNLNAEISTYNFMEMSSVFTAKHQDLLWKTTSRQMNKKAKNNIAMFLKTTPNKLKFLNPTEQGMAHYKAV